MTFIKKYLICFSIVSAMPYYLLSDSFSKVYYHKNEIRIEDYIPSLDFSSQYPQLHQITFFFSPFWFWDDVPKYGQATDDMGMSNNINVRSMGYWGPKECVTPLIFACMPSVESFEINDQNGMPYNLQWIDHTFPQLKSLRIHNFFNAQDEMPEILENISKVKSLENLAILWKNTMKTSFTVREKAIFAKMRHLKNLTLYVK